MTSAQVTPAASDVGYHGGMTISFSVPDYRAAMAWYRDRLGFTVIGEHPEAGFAELAPVADMNVTFVFGEGEPRRPGGPRPVIGVHDIEAALAALTARGVQFADEITTIPGVVRLARFRDLNGNDLTLYESLGA
jgi:catechol 2,3-dioxygenase-like lactoylglutathione lyase family enzyme